MKRTLLSLLAMASCAAVTSAQAQISDGIVKIGVLNDMSGLYSDITGQGSVVAAKFAVEDYLKASGSKLKVEVVGADHQNKPDIGSNISRQWYDTDKVVNTFAMMFPASDPKYVLVVTLDEPVDTSGSEPRRTAGWTAVPVAAEIVKRTAPLLGMRPKIEPVVADGLSAASN